MSAMEDIESPLDEADAHALLQHSTSDYLSLTPLGSGAEVGRSCHLLKFKGKQVLLDCGIHPAYSGIASLPFFDECVPSEIDLILITHFHLDHAAALPFFLARTDFKGAVYMTHPTKSIYKLILQDFIKVTELSVEEHLYSEHELLQSMDRISVCNYHQTVNHSGIRFTAYNAGHVLGAAMFEIEIAGVRVLYTGDYSRREDRHLMSAELPVHKPDVLIIEATYGVQTLQPVAERENRFTDLVSEIVLQRRGHCLLPVFALGRAQELLLILDEHWDAHPEIQHVPVYYASALAKKCMSVYQTYLNMMNKHIQKQSLTHNPFIFRHIRAMKSIDMDQLQAGPCVIMASPGMLQNGLSRELLELWAPDKRNGCVLSGYCVEGTLAKHIMSEPPFIQGMSGEKIPLLCSVHYISFSAHADFTETSEFIDALRPLHCILVHGEAVDGVGKLKEALVKKYRDTMNVIGPRNCQTVELEFRANKQAKIVGRLASQVHARASEGNSHLSGLIVRKDFGYTIMASEDLSQFTQLQCTSIRQSLQLHFALTFEALCEFVGRMYEYEAVAKSEETEQQDAQVKEDDIKAKTESKPDSASSSSGNPNDDSREEEETYKPIAPYLCVLNSVYVLYRPAANNVTLEWQSQPVADMIADSLMALLVNVQHQPGAAKLVGTVHGHDCTKHSESSAGDQHHQHEHGHAQETTSHKQEPQSHQAADKSATIDSPDKPAPAPCGTSRRKDLHWFLGQQYGAVDYNTQTRSFHLRVNNTIAEIDELTGSVQCTDALLRRRVQMSVGRAKGATQPLRDEIQLDEEESTTQTGAI